VRNEEIAAYWLTQGVVLTIFPLEALAGYGFGEVTLDHLSMVGLPADSDPYLNFDSRFNSISTAYKLGPEFGHLIRIGFDGAGNPLVINTQKDDCVEWLDHEDQFFAHYVNGSVQALSASMILYHQFVENLLVTRGPQAYEDADFTDEQLEKLKFDLSTVDEEAVTKTSFWQDEFATLLANRAYYKAS
jgi:hypothetical protein